MCSDSDNTTGEEFEIDGIRPFSEDISGTPLTPEVISVPATPECVVIESDCEPAVSSDELIIVESGTSGSGAPRQRIENARKTLRRHCTIHQMAMMQNRIKSSAEAVKSGYFTGSSSSVIQTREGEKIISGGSRQPAGRTTRSSTCQCVVPLRTSQVPPAPETRSKVTRQNSTQKQSLLEPAAAATSKGMLNKESVSMSKRNTRVTRLTAQSTNPGCVPKSLAASTTTKHESISQTATPVLSSMKTPVSLSQVSRSESRIPISQVTLGTDPVTTTRSCDVNKSAPPETNRPEMSMDGSTENISFLTKQVWDAIQEKSISSDDSRSSQNVMNSQVDPNVTNTPVTVYTSLPKDVIMAPDHVHIEW